MIVEQGKQDARWARTRQKLLEGGRTAFAHCGVEGATVLDIVRAAGVSQPSFYNHFKTKDELAREIAAEYFRRDSRVKRAVFDAVDDPAEAIAINIEQTLSIATNDPVIAWALVRSESLRNLMISGKTDPLVEMINAGVASDRFVVSSAATLALTIRGAALALVQELLNGTADENACRCFQELVLRMLGLSPQESAAVALRAAERIQDYQPAIS
jgi:AcrR family transcriptional regulator